MANYIGYFSDLNCNKYEVRITSSGDSSAYQEIMLAGDAPFTVTYNTSNTPFDPVRTSTATISIVHDDYLHDALSNCAQGTKVELLDVSDTAATITMWIGYLTPKVYDAGYENCFETFQLEAADCISSLQYIDYEEISGGSIVNLKKIINQICDACGELDGYYWTNSKRVLNGEALLPSHLSISEHNFQTNDTEEEWKLNDVLSEICRYLGFTCLQWGKSMYFIDYQYLEENNSIQGRFYSKSGEYNDGSLRYLSSFYTVTSGSYMSNGATISMEPVYNKIVVNANMYAADDFIPNPFDDKYLVNRINSGDTYANVEILPITPDKASFPHGGTWYTLGFQQAYKEEDVKDSKYRYFQRIYDNKYWESVYSTGNTYENLTDAQKAQSSITRDHRGATIVDLGVVEKSYRSETQQWIVPSRMDYTRYICICEKYSNPANKHYVADAQGKVVYRLKSGFRPRVMLDDKCFLVLNCSAIFERYENRNYINKEWTNTECTTRFLAAGHSINKVARPSFRIHIGDKGWSSAKNRWVNLNGGTSETMWDYCNPEMKWDEDEKSFWNKEIEILNNVSWEDKVNCDGIKIPLSGIDMTQPMTFEILNPDPSFYGNTGSNDFINKFYEYNAYCWIKDLSLKCVREGESYLGNDSDVVYENELDECSVNEMSEIKLKITTHTDTVKPSYSHMLVGSGFLHTIWEPSIPQEIATYQKPEENIIQKYVHQYGTPTKKITLTLGSQINPFQKLFGVDVDNPQIGYVQLGTEIDYRMGRQTITAVQKNK